MIAISAGLADLPSDLHSGFIDTFANRADIALHLLQVGPGIGQTCPHRVDIGLHRADIRLYRTDIATQAPLVAFEQIHLLRVHTAGRNRQSGQDK
jgi:hypothetical protein